MGGGRWAVGKGGGQWTVGGGRWTVDGGRWTVERWSGGGPAEAVELVGGGATNPVSVGSRLAQYAAGTVSDSQPQH